MPLSNTPQTYGAVTKTFHWLTALLIVSAIPLGIVASNLALALNAPGADLSEAAIDRVFLLFTLHKTIGVITFFVALARIAWALSQPKPGLLNGDTPPEAWAAETVHWLLYGSLVAVPLTGWVHHAATTGFAPVWWPFGQGLPFVPKDDGVAETAKTLHYILQWVLIGAIGAHIAGALKHHLIDGDATLRRMLPGHTPAQPTARQPGHALPAIAALAIWAASLGGGAALGWFSHTDAAARTATADAPATGNWQVQDGTLEISVMQMGSTVSGSFTDWTADITYDETADANGKHGHVDVTIQIDSLTIGTVTSQATGPDYLAVTQFPVSTFSAEILSTEGGLATDGTLTIRDRALPVTLPFDLTIEGDTATASGTLTIDRRDFNVGKGMTDANSLGFAVDINFNLTATRK